MDEARKKRAAALEEKKKRLEELRKKRAERGGAGGGDGDLDQSSSTSTTAPRIISPPPLTTNDDTAQLNDYINSLLSAPSPATGSTAASKEGGGASATSPRAGVVSPPPPPPSSSEGPPSSSSSAAPGQKARQRVIVKGIGKITITPAIAEVYHKGSQTDVMEDVNNLGMTIGGSGGANAHAASTPSFDATMSPRASMRRRGHTASHHHVPGKHTLMLSQTMLSGDGSDIISPSMADDVASTVASPKEDVPKALSQAEKEELMSKEAFRSFMSRSSLLMERILGQEETYDVLIDYGASRERRGENAENITRIMQFYDEKHCQDRAIMDLHWSPHYAELLLAAYNTSTAHTAGGPEALLPGAGAGGGSGANVGGGGGDPDGLVLVWSLALPSRPEYQFTCQSPVLTARFHDFDSHVVIGGCYSGQIVLWDTRAKSLPVQRTPLSATGHTHPVYSLGLSGTANAPTLVTASSDGRVCYWNLSQMNQPVEVVELRQDGSTAIGGNTPSSSILSSPAGVDAFGGRKTSRGVTITAFAFDHEKGADELIVGSESGHLCIAPSMHKQQQQPRGQQNQGLRMVEAHFGLVTGLSRHPSSSKNLSPLLLSSSVDWSMRLWNLKKSTDPLAIFNHGTYDYVADVKWCPTHPALFSSITSGGDLYLWNLNSSMEIPITKAFSVNSLAPIGGTGADGSTLAPSNTPTAPGASSSSSSSSTTGQHKQQQPQQQQRCTALTRVAWSTEGRKLAVGDAKGYLHILGVDEELTKARMDEEIRLEETLQTSMSSSSSSNLKEAGERSSSSLADLPSSSSSLALDALSA